MKIGLFCSTPMVALSRAVGRKRALEMLLTGRPIDAATAVEWGLINRVVPAAQLEDAVGELVDAIAASSPLTVGLGKEAFYAQIELDEHRAYDLHEDRDGHERAGGGRAGGHVRLPGEARAGVARALNDADPPATRDQAHDRDLHRRRLLRRRAAGHRGRARADDHVRARRRTNWHTHERGQLLFVLSGSGHIRVRGEEARPLRPGDTVWIPSDEEHWHGAGPESLLVHTAVSLGETRWLEPVADADYV